MTGESELAAGPLSARAKKKPGELVPAEHLPVARVVIDSPLPHLDRLFDYQVSADQAADAQPGTRVRVRFAGRLVDAFLLERADSTEHVGKLSYLDRVVSAEPVLAPEVAAVARAVADRYAGTLTDVLRLAVPPRHARTEQSTKALDAPLGPPAAVDRSAWESYTHGPAFLDAVAAGRAARAVWQMLPGEDWPTRLAEAAGTALLAGRGALIVVPDGKDLGRLDAAMTSVLGAGRHVALTADAGPAERYRRFLALRRGAVKVAIGTRGSALSPVHDLGLLVVLDDGDDLHAEPRSPYPHTREILTLRSALQGAALVVAGVARTAESQLLVESGWAVSVTADRAVVRACAPRIEAAGDERATGADSAAAHARLSPAAFAATRAAIAAGLPVLVQVPRAGYVPLVACERCRRPARCRQCQGPIALSARGMAGCRWCGTPAANWSCGACGGRSFRAMTSGARRTAEELGRAFPGVQLITSAGDHVHAEVPAAPALVVATPGAEPYAVGGYGAALLLDGSALLARPDLRAAEEALRRWLNAASLVRSHAEGGRVVVGADTSLPTVQAVIRWDPVGHAAAELDARRELGFPPAMAMAVVEGSAAAVGAFLGDLELPETGEVLGPVMLEHPQTGERALLRVPPAQRRALAAALHVTASGRSARKDPEIARVRVDPLTLI